LESICAIPFARVHGRPTHCNYETLKEEASALASEVENITYAWSKNATDDCGLLADILGADKYDELTGIDSYAIPCKPASYNPLSPMPHSHTSANGRKKNGSLYAPPGLFARGSSEASSTTYMTPLTNNTTPSSCITSRRITTSPPIESLNTSMTVGAPSTFKQRRC
jgi:hypothetical protein